MHPATDKLVAGPSPAATTAALAAAVVADVRRVAADHLALVVARGTLGLRGAVAVGGLCLGGVGVGIGALFALALALGFGLTATPWRPLAAAFGAAGAALGLVAIGLAGAGHVTWRVLARRLAARDAGGASGERTRHAELN